MVQRRLHLNQTDQGTTNMCILVRIAFSVFTIAGALCVNASASIVSISTGSILVGNHSTNLITNGSFETRAIGDPAITTDVNWSGVAYGHKVLAQDSSGGIVYAIPGWGQTSSSGAYGVWGPGAGTARGGAACVDGAACLYFGNWFTGTGSANPAVFHANGTVTYATPPIFTNTSGINSSPTTLFQTLTGLTVGDEYLLDFWASGEDNSPNSFRPDAGVFGLSIGADSLFLTAPSPTSLLAANSIRYNIKFKATSINETLTFTNWGHVTGTSTELILDDVVLNHTPEPNTVALILPALFLLFAIRRPVALRRSDA